MFEKRATAPTEQSQFGEAQSYRVWSYDPSYLEEPLPWQCVAAFKYLTECLDYIAYCQDKGADVVFQSPADTKLIRASDRRVVYKPKSDAVDALEQIINQAQLWESCDNMAGRICQIARNGLPSRDAVYA